MRVLVVPVALAAMLAVAGCSETAARTGTGAAVGAGAGAVVTAVTGGCVACGAAIGAGVGAVGGYAYDQWQKGKGN